MKKIVIVSICTIVVLVNAASCKKGDTGPAGAEGKKGTANVQYTAWFNPTAYKKDTIFGIWGFSHTQPVPAITQQILDSGTVLTFAKLLGYNPAVWPATQVGQLPITVTYMQGGLQNDTWAAGATVGNVRIRFINDHNIYTSIATQHVFRCIIIPGGTPVPTGRMAQLSYEDICRKYNIPE